MAGRPFIDQNGKFGDLPPELLDFSPGSAIQEGFFKFYLVFVK